MNILTSVEIGKIADVANEYRTQYMDLEKGEALDRLVYQALKENPEANEQVHKNVIIILNGSLKQPDDSIWLLPLPGGIFLLWRFVDGKIHMRAGSHNPDALEELKGETLCNNIIRTKRHAFLDKSYISAT